MRVDIDPKKIVVFTGAGVSAESGLATFRDSDGLWNNYAIADVASVSGWQRDPQRVLAFYNERRHQARHAQPNAAHNAIAALETRYQVTVITQNVDDLHERAGSSTVIHLHGELGKARSSVDQTLIYPCDEPIRLGDLCTKGSQLRPHIVWFGEPILEYEIARQHFKRAAKVLVIGTSLSVYPATNLLKQARYHAEKIIVSLEIDNKPYGYTWRRGKACDLVPHLVSKWLNDGSSDTSWSRPR